MNHQGCRNYCWLHVLSPYVFMLLYDAFSDISRWSEYISIHTSHCYRNSTPDKITVLICCILYCAIWRHCSYCNDKDMRNYDPGRQIFTILTSTLLSIVINIHELYLFKTYIHDIVKIILCRDLILYPDVYFHGKFLFISLFIFIYSN